MPDPRSHLHQNVSARCERTMEWIGQCKNEAVTTGPALCESHARDECWCGLPAVRDCGAAGSFVCGRPLCAAHRCPSHDREGKAQREAWKLAQMPDLERVMSVERKRRARERHAALLSEADTLEAQVQAKRAEAEALHCEYSLDV